MSIETAAATEHFPAPRILGPQPAAVELTVGTHVEVYDEFQDPDTLKHMRELVCRGIVRAVPNLNQGGTSRSYYNIETKEATEFAAAKGITGTITSVIFPDAYPKLYNGKPVVPVRQFLEVQPEKSRKEPA